MPVSNNYLLFSLNKENFAVNVEQIISIEKMTYVRSVPKASSYIKGLAEVRNEPTAIIDLKSILDMQVTAETDLTRIIVVQMDDLQIGLIIDEALEIQGINDSDIQPTPQILATARDAYLRGVVKVDNTLVLVLALERILNASETTELRKLIKEVRE